MRTYWEEIASEKPLPLLKKPCEGCAITTGFYVEYADELLQQPIEIQEKVRKSWFCHDHPGHCCKGLDLYIKARRGKNVQTEAP